MKRIAEPPEQTNVPCGGLPAHPQWQARVWCMIARQWRGPIRHYLWVVAFCCVIAVLTTAIWPRRSYPVQLCYALSVGTICWAVIEFGRHLINEPGYSGWPRGWRGFALTSVG